MRAQFVAPIGSDMDADERKRPATPARREADSEAVCSKRAHYETSPRRADVGFLLRDEPLVIPLAAIDCRVINNAPMSRAAILEMAVRRQHESWQEAVLCSLRNADQHARDLLMPALSEDDPRCTMRAISQLSAEQIWSLPMATRTLIEGLQRRTNVRLQKLHLAAQSQHLDLVPVLA